MNLKLELLNYFDLTRCLCELKTESGESGITAPKEYISDGNWDNVDFDAFDGVSYWRLRDEITTTPLENAYKAGKRVEITVPLKLVFSVRREKLTADDAYSYDRIRQTIVKQFNIDDGDLKTSLGAEKILITSPTANGDAKEVWDGETANTGTFEPKYEVVFGSVDIDVTITSKGECLPTECDDVDSDILHAFDFCNAAVRDRLTETQIDCLIDAYCGACDPATLTVNGNTFTTVDSGDTLDIAVHDTSNTDVGTVVSTSEIEIADSTNEVNGVDISDPTVAEGTHNQVIQNSAATPIGTAANPSVIADSQAQVNGVDISDPTVAEGTHDQQIHNSAGSDVGTAANPSVISDNTINFNGSDVDSVKAEETYTFTVELDSVESGTYDAGTNTVSVTSPTCVELSVTLSDDEPDFGDTITITGTASGFTPDSYKFFVFDGTDATLLAFQVGNTYDYLVNSLIADIEIYVMGVESGVDIVGGGEFATVNNIPTITDSVHFNGTNNYATVAADSIFDFGTGEISMGMWIKTDTVAGNDGLFETSYGSNGIMIRRVGVNVELYLNGGGATVNNVGYFTGEAGSWVHMLWTRTAAGLVTMYKNGVFFASGTETASLTDSKPLIWGKWTTEYFEGNMLTPFFVDRLLTGTEITEASGTPAADPSGFSFYANIIEYWNFGTGDTIPTLIGGKEGKNATTTNMTAGNIEADVP